MEENIDILSVVLDALTEWAPQYPREDLNKYLILYWEATGRSSETERSYLYDFISSIINPKMDSHSAHETSKLLKLVTAVTDVISGYEAEYFDGEDQEIVNILVSLQEEFRKQYIEAPESPIISSDPFIAD